ncbi:uncharacterized protein ARMOST_12184 [Armillaria ostoyae]|uniref:Uncharacterized protein n=1 Tax=Armillaria ostoyae TaxID=47428 RepID=A0A284RJ94_ARMOS|nr:uncharacterized protein ARMOST_12184 [Armillaria ostoyae]
MSEEYTCASACFFDPTSHIRPTDRRQIRTSSSHREERVQALHGCSLKCQRASPGQQLCWTSAGPGKKSKFGKYGNTMAHSAAGGVGFGAGAAIGGGLVRAIF